MLLPVVRKHILLRDSGGIALATFAEKENALAKPSAAEIRAQLDRILASSFFKNTKRHPHFLRFIIEKTLSGDAHEIKERLIGAAIFDRKASYDLASDPIVRVAAADIRKRLAQYYDQEEPGSNIRISLPIGSYVPHFIPAKSRPKLKQVRSIATDAARVATVIGRRSLARDDIFPEPMEL